MQPSEHFVNQSLKILPQLSGLRLWWYPSINFSYEINLKVLMMYLLLLDLKGWADFLIGKFEEALYFPSALVFVAYWQDSIIFESILCLQNSVEYLCLKHLVHPLFQIWGVELGACEVLFFVASEEIIYSFFSFFPDTFWNSIYLTYVPQF